MVLAVVGRELDPEWVLVASVPDPVVAAVSVLDPVVLVEKQLVADQFGPVAHLHTLQLKLKKYMSTFLKQLKCAPVAPY